MNHETLSALKLALLCRDSYWGQKFLPKPVGSKLHTMKGLLQNDETLFLAKTYVQKATADLGLDLTIHAAFEDGRLCITIGGASWRL